jgi:Uncharacterised nucleotidyltransferase
VSGAAAAARGRIVSRTLRRAWLLAPPAAEISAEELLTVVPALLRTASAPLAFWRNRSIVDATPALAGLHDAWRLQTLHGAVFEERLAVAVSRLRAVSVEPLLAKGWAIARLYPRPGLRPYGDLDLYVRPSEYAAARAAVDSLPGIAVDLHRGLPDLDERDHDAVLARAVRETAGRVEVRVLCPEDHLRLLCRHFLRHGASRPVWLCDVALLVETRGPGFDWDRVLAGSRRRRDAVLAALGLAGALLGADLIGTPAVSAGLPAWLVPTVLRQWGAGFGHRDPLATYLSRPAAFCAELRRHWPNAIEASAALDAPFDGRSRLPFQLAHLIVRGTRFGLSLARASPAS